MGLSLGRIGSINTTSTIGQLSSVRDRNYQVSNEAGFSDAYLERVNAGAGASNGITPVDPVQYPNASRMVTAENRVKQLDADIETQKAYNKLAERFSGNTSYDALRQGVEYSVAGAHIDAYA
ncbi:MAG: hypothetical protein II745_07000 [Lachnospiraceae bacterium]|nr:hypothetical protein [Lachnospiraceae bacterium]